VAKSKYTPERIKTILEAIRQQGGDRAGWEAGNISEDTFYHWAKKYPEFSEAVAQAKDDYRRNCPEEIKKQARRSLSDYLFGGSIEVWEATETIMDANGQIISIKQISKKVRRGPPQWVIDRVLGQPISELESIKSLTESGWLKEQVIEKLATAMDKFNESAKAAFQGDLDDEDLEPQSGG
jgi:hypothetical protein